MLHLALDDLAPGAPHLPHRRWGTLVQLAASAALHATLIVIVALVTSTVAPRIELRRADADADLQVRHVVFLAPEVRRIGSGGGGGGNRQAGPMRRAQSVGNDTITQRVRSTPPPAPTPTAAAPVLEDVEPLSSILLEAKPLSSGLLDQIGVPAVGVLSGTSTGPGSGGGVGSGHGTGIGSGRGPGLGSGSGGGTGGGIYRSTDVTYR